MKQILKLMGVVKVTLLKIKMMYPNITITPNDDNTYSVDYQIDEVELNGMAKPYNTGRCIEYNFEVSYFNTDDDEQYYDDNYEEIELQVLTELDNYLILNNNGCI